MGGMRKRNAIACGVALLACQPLALASPLDLDLKTKPISAKESVNDDTQLDSGLELALSNALMNVALNYKVQSRFGESGDLLENGTSQRVGAQLHSSVLDSLLDGKTRIATESVFITGSDKYKHQFNPTYSRPLLGLATLDMGYRYGLEGSAAATAEDRSSAYEFGLKGSLSWLPVNWSGGYVTSSKLKGSNQELINTESFKLESNYTVSPQMTVKLFSNLKEQEKSRASSITNSSELRYGAGLVWQPSSEYALDLKIDKQTLSSTGEESILSRGAVSWFPEEGLELSLEYGDQLIDGARGLMLNTAFDLDRLWNFSR